MKLSKSLALVLVVVMMMVAVVPAQAQLGTTNTSWFDIQNVDTKSATVTITLVDGSGNQLTPTALSSTLANPFTLAIGKSQRINLAQIPADQNVPSGSYSVIISSTAKVVAVATLQGKTGSRAYHGAYPGWSSAGETSVFLPTFYHNFSGWYSMITVQNLGTDPANVKLTITCGDAGFEGAGVQGEFTLTGLASMASHTWVLKSERPTNPATSTVWASTQVCRGSTVVESTNGQPITATDNQNKVATGNTISNVAVVSGGTKLYAPALYSWYAIGWKSGVTVRKIGAGTTDVSINFSDGTAPYGFQLTDASPAKTVFIPDVHPASGLFAATITTNPATEIAAVINTGVTTSSVARAIGYYAFAQGTGSNVVFTPVVANFASNWKSGVVCQNIGTIATKVQVEYEGYAPYTVQSGGADLVLQPEENVQLYTPSSGVATGFRGDLTVTALEATAEIACLVNLGQDGSTLVGDWSTGYNGFSK